MWFTIATPERYHLKKIVLRMYWDGNPLPAVIEATSFGGVHTTAERRAWWGGDEIPEGFIRLSAGCEDSQDLVDDVAQALDEI